MLIRNDMKRNNKRDSDSKRNNSRIEEIRSKRLGKAFAPGHTTGFFEIRDMHRELLKKGSRGSGVCLSKGAITKVVLEPSDKQIVSIFINGEQRDASQAPVSSNVVKRMLGNVVAASTGGITIRKKEGVPPFGFIDNIFDSVKDRDIELCVISGKIQTKSVLTDEKKRVRIIEAGRKAMRDLLKSPTLENMFLQSRKFAIQTRLIDEKVREAVEAACIEGLATMSMLGNSLFASGVEARRLQKYGSVIECKIDEKGPRIIE
jgi:pantoate kinase